MRTTTYRLAMLIAVAAATAAAISYPWRYFSQDDTGYRIAVVERGSITVAVAATGTINPVTAVRVGTQVSGQLQSVQADYNSMVRKGQLIARIDPTSFELRVTQASAELDAARTAVLTQQANCAAAEAELSRARAASEHAARELDRNRALQAENFISAAALDKAKTEADAAQEQVKMAQARLVLAQAQVRAAKATVRVRQSQFEQAKVDLDRTEIRAPVDGIVVTKLVEPGQTVAASLQAPDLFMIAKDLREMQVETSIDESEVGRVRAGQPAWFTVDSFPGKTFRGTVAHVRKAPQVVQNVVTYIAIIRAANPEAALFPGMSANVRIQTDSRSGVLKVPNAALRFKPAEHVDSRSSSSASPDRRQPVTFAAATRRDGPRANARLWVPTASGTPRAVPVELGVTDGQYTEVVRSEGLSEGDAVIVGTISKSRSTGTKSNGPRFAS